MKGEDGLEHVDSWLEEGLPPEETRELRGTPLWWENNLSPHEEILGESPATARREQEREYSERYGWIYDIGEALYWYAASWWTADTMLALFRASYGVLMLALLFGIIYSVFYATANGPNVRTLPTVEELMQPASQPEEGSPIPMEGLIDIDEKN